MVAFYSAPLVDQPQLGMASVFYKIERDLPGIAGKVRKWRNHDVRLGRR